MGIVLQDDFLKVLLAEPVKHIQHMLGDTGQKRVRELWWAHHEATRSTHIREFVSEVVNRTGSTHDRIAKAIGAKGRSATGLMEDEYLATVRKGYDKGEKGKRGIDYITQAFARLVTLMEDNRDYLGDLFCGGITRGHGGQFFTPESLTNLMAELTIDPEAKDETISDPCCGSGRMLLAYATKKRPGELVGQDIDLRCVRMTAINLALRNLYGYVLWGNSLAGEVKLGYPASRSDYACLADSAAYLSRFARGVAREFGRENDPEAEGKCETFQLSVHSLNEAASRIPQEPYFGLASTDPKVVQYTERLRISSTELSKLEQELGAHHRENPRQKAALLTLFVRIGQALTAFAHECSEFENYFRGLA